MFFFLNNTQSTKKDVEYDAILLIWVVQYDAIYLKRIVCFDAFVLTAHFFYAKLKVYGGVPYAEKKNVSVPASLEKQ